MPHWPFSASFLCLCICPHLAHASSHYQASCPTVGVTGGLDCRPLPQRLLLISCPAALPGRGWRRVTAVFSAACLPEFQPEAPQRPGRELLMRAVPLLSPTPFKKSSGLGLPGLRGLACSIGACWYKAPESDACSFLEPQDTRTRCSGQKGVREQKMGVHC